MKRTRIAALVTGTAREVEFILDLMPHLLSQNYQVDTFLVIRHVATQERSHFGQAERDFTMSQLASKAGQNVFLAELPSFDGEDVSTRYLTPVGPTDIDRERAMLSMFHGVFAGAALIKAALRSYSHVLKTRSDYLPPQGAPWIDAAVDRYNESDGRMIVDGLVTIPQRYPDRLDIPWQGSLSDLFFFGSSDQFFRLWDFPELLPKLWTGIVETTLFRAALLRFVGDELQSRRRNETFLAQHFAWDNNNTKQSFHLLRAGVLPDSLKSEILSLLNCDSIEATAANVLIRQAYDFIMGGCFDVAYLSSQGVSESVVERVRTICEEAKVTCRPI